MSNLKINQRPIPKEALDDPDSIEMLRVWIAQKRLFCSMKIGMYKETTTILEEKAWGIILADAAKHLANALYIDDPDSSSQDERLERIRDFFIAELNRSTSKVDGAFVNDPRHQKRTVQEARNR